MRVGTRGGRGALVVESSKAVFGAGMVGAGAERRWG